MHKPADFSRSSDVEQALEALFTSPAPDAAFVTDLEARLLARAGRLAAPPAPTPPAPRRLWTRLTSGIVTHRLATVAVALLLALLVALTAIGPRRVWADLQRLLGYVPGIGFVDLDESLVLVSPVEVTRDGVTLRVEQVVAGPSRTTVVIRSSGLPPEEQRPPDGTPGAIDERPLLRLPDGRALEAPTFTLRRGGGTLEFPALPDGVYRATLELPRLPLVPAGAAPEQWSLPLVLRPATGELAAELFPQPYTPTGASASHAGIMVRVLEVAQSPEETLLRVQAQWSNPDWKAYWIDGGLWLPELRDDLGHVYEDTMPSSAGSVVQTTIEQLPLTPAPAPASLSVEQAMAFAPVSPAARELTLVVPGLEFEVPADGTFTVDLGDDPRVGDAWPLDLHLSVAGLPVHVTGMRLLQQPLGPHEGAELRMLLEFNLAPTPEQDGRTLFSVFLEGEHPAWGGGGGGYSSERGIRASLELREGQAIPGGPLTVRITSASMIVHGPWTIRWRVPGAAQEDAAVIVPRILRPQDSSQTRDQVTLRVDRVTLTDRLTAVRLTLAGWPGATLGRILVAFDSESREDELWLQDDRGRRYEPVEGEARWQPPGEAESYPDTITFPPVQPLARRLSLNVSAVEVRLPGEAGFDVLVPAETTVIRSAGKPPASEPWPIDIQVEVAGYHLRFDAARLEEINGRIMLMLAPPMETREGTGRQPATPCLARVTAPGGRIIDASGFFYSDEPCFPAVAFEVVDPRTFTVQPGRYHVELDGVAVVVKGPWQLSWDVQAP